MQPYKLATRGNSFEFGIYPAVSHIDTVFCLIFNIFATSICFRPAFILSFLNGFSVIITSLDIIYAFIVYLDIIIYQVN